MTQNIAPILALVLASLVVSVQGVSDNNQEPVKPDVSSGYTDAPPPPYRGPDSYGARQERARPLEDKEAPYERRDSNNRPYVPDTSASNREPDRRDDYRRQSHESSRSYVRSSSPQRSEEPYRERPPYDAAQPSDTSFPNRDKPIENKPTSDAPAPYNDRPRPADIPRSDRGPDGPAKYMPDYEQTRGYGPKTFPSERARESLREPYPVEKDPQPRRSYGERELYGDRNSGYGKEDRVWNENELESGQFGKGYDEYTREYRRDDEPHREPEWKPEHKPNPPPYKYDNQVPAESGHGGRYGRERDYYEPNARSPEFRRHADEREAEFNRRKSEFEEYRRRMEYERGVDGRQSRPNHAKSPSRQGPPVRERYDDKDQFHRSSNDFPARDYYRGEPQFGDLRFDNFREQNPADTRTYDYDYGYGRTDRVTDDYRRGEPQEIHRKNSVPMPARGDRSRVHFPSREQEDRFLDDPLTENKYNGLQPGPTYINNQVNMGTLGPAAEKAAPSEISGHKTGFLTNFLKLGNIQFRKKVNNMSAVINTNGNEPEKVK